MAAADTTKPVLTALVLPTSVNVTKGSASATATVGAKDVGLGVESVYINLDKSFQTTYGRSSGFYLYDSQDSFADGKSSTSTLLTSSTASGTYGITSVTVYDKAGNYSIYYKDELARLGFQTSFTVKGAAADTTKPVLTALVLPTSVNVTKGSASATATVGAKDVGLGVESVYINLDKSFQTTYGRSSGFYLYDSQDSFADGKSSTSTLLTSSTASGTYGITSVTVYDKAGNYSIYYKDELTRLGFQTSFTVKGAAADTTKPVLTALVLPTSVNVTKGSASATATVGAKDVGLGVESVYINLDKSFQTTYGRSSGFYLYDSQDSFADGKSSTSTLLTSSTASGTYGITSVTVYDKAGNYSIYYKDELARLGFQTSFIVTDITKIFGTRSNDLLRGTEGPDYLDGRLGADMLSGLAGDDTYIVDNTGDRVIEAARQGSDTVITTVSYALKAGQEIEILRAAASVKTAALDLNGNDFSNTLIGNAGDNILNGKGGADTLRGLDGDDTYIIDNPFDHVAEGRGQGTDTVISTVSYVLQAGQEVETLRFAASVAHSNLDLTGNAFANTLIGNAGSNVLDGKAGADVLVGGAGADTFVFSTKPSSTNTDLIVRFSTAEDTIQLAKESFLTLPVGELAQTAFKTLSTDVVDADDRILFNKATGEVFYDADGRGSQKAVLFAVLDRPVNLTHHDFLVV